MIFFGFAASTLLTLAAGGGRQATSTHAWMGYGGGPQHQATATVAAAPVQRILWSASLDDSRSYYGDEVLIHYASPLITSNNTVIHSYRFTTQVNGSPNYDNWRIIARNGKNGSQKWSYDTDYSAPVVFPNDWTSVYPLSLAGTNSVAAAGAGGTVMVRGDADSSSSSTARVCFYSKLADYSSDPSAFANIKICTPLTGDSNGNVWFGYAVVGTVPSSVSGALGAGGVARITTSGLVAFRSVASLGIDPSLVRPALNASPAVSVDGKSVYFALVDGSLTNCYLAKLDSQTLATQASVKAIDPQVGQGALMINESSAAPMVGPDGHVFMGVFGYFWRESHGWMLQFDQNLSQFASNGKRYPVGSFGWDDTASVVPSSIVPSYQGSSSYLILSKYNNYAIGDGDGVNKVAVLDPGADDKTTDRQSGIPVMNEVLTVVGPTPDPEAGEPNAVREWCINSAAIDVKGKAAIINSEDGHCYRWSFVENKLTQALSLQPATGEAYTCTAIGPDGTSYAINNSILFAVGGAAAYPLTSAKMYQGTTSSGTTSALVNADSSYFSVASKLLTGVGHAAAVQVTAKAPFPASQAAPPLYVNVTGFSSSSATTLQVFIKNVKTGAFDLLQYQPFMGTTTISASLSDAASYVSATGTVTVVARALRPQRQQPFTAKFDQITISSGENQN
ncbi:MAG TPA: hypothetical protein VG944_07755 [Fimbriimonas sp.]|nr:hypothetical protein [Fimbriimonas sp.]